MDDGFATLHKILIKIMLKKAKTDKDKHGDQILVLPDKTEHEILVEMSETEMYFYDKMRESTE